jgi:hypothetical protein
LEVGPKRKFVIFEVIFHHAMFGNFWSPGSTLFIFYKLESIGYLENFWNKRKELNGLGRMNSAK